MFTREDEYTEAIRGSRIHEHDNDNNNKLFLKQFFSLTTVAILGYVGFNYSNNISSSDNLKVTTSAIAQIDAEYSKNDAIPTNVKDEYLEALETMEVETLGESTVNSYSTIDLSKEIKSIVEDVEIDKSIYALELNREINVEDEKKAKVIVVQEGDTLAGISKKVYGSETKYTKIMASNSELLNDPSMIYVGQEIILP